MLRGSARGPHLRLQKELFHFCVVEGLTPETSLVYCLNKSFLCINPEYPIAWLDGSHVEE